MTVGTSKISLEVRDSWDLGRSSQRIIKNNHIMVASNNNRVSGRVDDDDVDWTAVTERLLLMVAEYNSRAPEDQQIVLPEVRAPDRVVVAPVPSGEADAAGGPVRGRNNEHDDGWDNIWDDAESIPEDGWGRRNPDPVDINNNLVEGNEAPPAVAQGPVAAVDGWGRRNPGGEYVIRRDNPANRNDGWGRHVPGNRDDGWGRHVPAVRDDGFQPAFPGDDGSSDGWGRRDSPGEEVVVDDQDRPYRMWGPINRQIPPYPGNDSSDNGENGRRRAGDIAAGSAPIRRRLG